MSIRWITQQLGTASALEVQKEDDLNIIDVRDLVDKEGNRPQAVRQKINEGSDSLRAGKKTVVCCDYGISRSNAIAAGILALYEAIPFESAARRVLEATGEKEIKTQLLQVVREALGVDRKRSLHQKRRVLITGGSGFIRKSVCQNLVGLCEVFSPSRSELDLQLGSTQLDLMVSERKIECIVHLANPRIYNTNSALGNTLTMLRNVLDVCVTHDVRLIYLSGWEVYSGYRSSKLVADESMPLLPKGPYGEAKYLAEMLIEHSRRTQGLRCTMLRSSPVYGIGSDKPRFIFTFIEKIERSQNIITHLYNNGDPALDLLYIDDLVSAIAKSIDSEFEGNLNIGTGVTTTTRRIAEILQELLKVKVDIDSVRINTDTAVIALDASKARKTLDWNPTISVPEGLQLILENLKQTKGAP